MAADRARKPASQPAGQDGHQGACESVQLEEQLHQQTRRALSTAHVLAWGTQAASERAWDQASEAVACSKYDYLPPEGSSRDSSVAIARNQPTNVASGSSVVSCWLVCDIEMPTA